jgi:hypothetical protein
MRTVWDGRNQEQAVSTNYDLSLLTYTNKRCELVVVRRWVLDLGVVWCWNGQVLSIFMLMRREEASS